MKGIHTLTIQSAHLKYEMKFSRNITIIQGDSATGKTTLVDMIQEYLLNGSDTGISLNCDIPCRVVSGNTWIKQLEDIENSIVFIDEGNRFVSSHDFAVTINGSSNYYVIITREALYNLPYSVTEIYGIRSSGKFGSLTPIYHHMYRIYPSDSVSQPAKSNTLVVEDTNSGYEFFSGLLSGTNKKCISAGGASGIFDRIMEIKPVEGYEQITVIADGAAFGSQMSRLYSLSRYGKCIQMYLPESFEWIILSSDVLEDGEVRRILEKPSEYIDSREYVSWERFFTSILTSKSSGSWMQYSKSKLNPVYLQGKCRDRILAVIPERIREFFSS